VTDSLLFQIALLLGLAAAGLWAFERIRLPAIAGFLVVGAIAGPEGLGLVGEPERVRTLAELGVVFLLFEIGLELPLERIRSVWRSALLAGGGQVLLTVLVVAGTTAGFGLDLGQALILGGIVSMSSTALVMRILVDRGQVDSPQGQLAVSVLIIQDLSIVPFLLAIPFLSGGEGGGAASGLLSLVRVVAALGLVVAVVRLVVPRVLERMTRLNSPDLFSLLALVLVLASALFAEELGLTLAVGAFLAGAAASASPYAQQLFAEVIPLRGVLLGLFFTAVGMLFAPGAAIAYAPWVLAYLVATIVLKTTIVAGISALLLRRGLRVGVAAGLVLSQTGEFSFVLADAAHSAGLLDTRVREIVIAGSVLSLVATPFLVRLTPLLSDFAVGLLERFVREPTPLPPVSSEGEAEKARVVVVGFGPAGQTLARLLRSLGDPYVIVDANADSVETGHAQGEPILYGDATRPPFLKRLDVEHARLVAIAISDPLATRRMVTRIRKLAPDTPILARTRFVAEVDVLEGLGASVVVAEEYEGSIEVVARTLELFHYPTSAVAKFTDALRDEGYGAIRSPLSFPIDPWLMELLEEVDNAWVVVPDAFSASLSLSDLGIRARTGASVLAVEREGETLTNPPPDFGLRAGDRLLVLGDAHQIEALSALLAAP